MATTAQITLTSDITDDSLSIDNTANLYLAGGTTDLNTLTSVTKVLSSQNQVDLITTGSVSTTHAYVYINNPSEDESEYFIITIGNAGAGSPTDTEEIGRLYGGDWMLMPYLATDANEDIMVQPSSSDKMTLEYAVFHQ